MSELSLFPESDAYEGDPLRPDVETPTPLSIVASLTRPDRERRVRHLTEQASDILADAVETHGRGRTLKATCVLFSGGNDSTVLAHMFRSTATHAVHANTTIGIEATRQFVRDTCASWGLPLIEKVAPVSYRDLVIERGFPGPGMHWKMYGRLKERALDLVRHELGIANSRTEYALYVAGRRRQESERRADVPLHEADGSVVWCSPLALWTKLDLTTYRLMFGDVPSNDVAAKLHMSGECLCGAFAKPGELEEIGYWFPEVRAHIEALEREVRAHIEALEREVRAAGHEQPFCTWGHGQGEPSKSGRLCGSCDIRFQSELFEATA